MFSEDNYEQVFSHRLNQQSIEIIKNFFVFQPNRQAGAKPYSSLMTKPIEYQGLVHRKYHKFTAGFLPSQRNATIMSDKHEQKVPLLVHSGKLQVSDQSTFLEGLTNRINMESEKLLDGLNPESKELQDETPRVEPKQPMDNAGNFNYLFKAKKQNRTKYGSLPSASTTSAELPVIGRRTSRRLQQIEPLTPTGLKGSLTPSCPPAPAKNSTTERGSEAGGQSSSKGSAGIHSAKIMKPMGSHGLERGLIAYDPEGREFWQRNRGSFVRDPTSRSSISGVSAKSYLAIRRSTLEIVAEKNSDNNIEIASLSKIMTCYLTLLVCRKYNIDLQSHHVRVSDKAQEMPGTSAQLQAGDILTLLQLLYALMLPSGNDASVAIAESVGKIIQKHRHKPSKKSYSETFIYYMNYLSRELCLHQSFQNPSGLSSNPNVSSPRAITLLTAICLHHPTFTSIVNCKEYSLQIRNQRFGLTRKITWVNTNKLLWKGWEGVKTGTTETAGHCLMAAKGDYIVGVFDCDTLGRRFSECARIYQFLTT